MKKDYSNDPYLSGLNVYEVGGAVRDRFISGVNPKDRDFVIVGLDESDLESGVLEDRGFEKVGKSFAVYLHPDTGDEFAIARTESKTDKGYYGFDWEVTDSLEKDLERRDLTINAIARNIHTGKIIDPFGGRDDIKNKLLRHVSIKFKEDPVRVLRLARFAARYGYRVYSGTESLAKEVVNELDYVPEERIKEELKKAFKEAQDIRSFFDVMDRTGALQQIVPELKKLQNVPAGPREYHKEGDTYNHTIMVIDELLNYLDTSFSYSGAFDFDRSILGFMGLAHDLGKLATDESKYPNHQKHDKKGVSIAKDIANRLKLSNELKQAMVDATKYHIKLSKVFEMRESKVIRLVEKLSRGNHPSIHALLLLILCDVKGRIPEGNFNLSKAVSYINEVRDVIDQIDGNYVMEKWPDAEGEKIGDLLLQERVRKLKEEGEE